MTVLTPQATRRSRRFAEQRWVLDAVVRTVGLDWDQGRTGYAMGPCGLVAAPDFAHVARNVHAFDDISREFATAGARRLARARTAVAEAHPVAARAHYFVASVLFGQAQWPLFENSDYNDRLERLKNDAYARFAAVADHPVIQVELPWDEDRSLPGWLHLPAGASAASPAGCVLAIGGMDSAKELLVNLCGDPLLQRGLAVLALDGPGQASCPVRGIFATPDCFPRAGRLALDYLAARPEIDSDRIALRAVSMGTMWATQIAASTDGLAACAVSSACQETGGPAIFGEASPTFKTRFMYMTDYEDEAAFDEVTSDLVTVDGCGPRIDCPFLEVAGEDDELCALEAVFALFNDITAPKELVILQGERHGLHTAAAGASFDTQGYVADWLADRLGGRELDARLRIVSADGQITDRPWDHPLGYEHPLPDVVLAGVDPRPGD